MPPSISKLQSIHCKVSAISRTAIQKTNFLSTAACLDFAQTLRLVEVNQDEGTCRVLDKGRSIREMYKYFSSFI